MSKTRIQRFAVVQPIGRAPYKDRADLDYRDNAELATQLTMYARSKWPLPQRIDVDVHAKQIIVDGTPRANYSIHEYRPTTPGAGQ
ncbi:hypothetical protein SEA_ELESAR_40 [Arthrobacter phage Elesar]|uniref:Uncharacterized protein n=1 Tax=Arthrobacter phage Elesar TaxID=2510522 RepID=A0A411CQ93_9CAUD|nr:hypothetical protein QEO79_gp56 [Arthrobacter phage Elesar]QAY16091.1 hypothetical protein SEA_ELESAR_40 [Arthrobacter phage Elesar]